MTMFEAWAIWSGNQPERIAESAAARPPNRPQAVLRLDQLNERVLSDIGMSKLGFPVAHH